MRSHSRATPTARASVTSALRTATASTASAASTARSPARTRGRLAPRAVLDAERARRPRQHLLAQDVIWVGGGSVANLLAVWRVHGLDEIMREAWEAGVVLAGVSAGSICWHVGGTTDSFGLDLQPVTNGLAPAPLRQRRALRLRGAPPTPAAPARRRRHAADVLRHRRRRRAALSRHRARRSRRRPSRRRGLRVERGVDGSVVETRIEPRLLASPAEW